MNIISSAFGRYPASEYLPDGPFVRIGHSFGTSTDEGSPNRAIVDSMLAVYGDSSIVVDGTLADAFPNPSPRIDHIVRGEISDGVGHGVGSWGTLLEAKEYMERQGINTAVMFGQAHHIGRILMQANKLGLNSVALTGQTREFDRRSDQPWTRSLSRWIPRELVGSFVLRAQKKL